MPYGSSAVLLLILSFVAYGAFTGLLRRPWGIKVLHVGATVLLVLATLLSGWWFFADPATRARAAPDLAAHEARAAAAAEENR